MKLKLTEEQRKQVLSAYENKELIELEVFEPKPEKKIIKLDEMVGSDIDCEFISAIGEINSRSKLINIDYNSYYGDEYRDSWARCRIRQDHPHANIWKKCPLPEGLKIAVIYYGGGVSGNITDYHNINWAEVSRFYVYGTADGWHYEWQKEKEE